MRTGVRVPGTLGRSVEVAATSLVYGSVSEISLPPGELMSTRIGCSRGDAAPAAFALIESLDDMMTAKV